MLRELPTADEPNTYFPELWNIYEAWLLRYMAKRSLKQEPTSTNAHDAHERLCRVIRTMIIDPDQTANPYYLTSYCHDYFLLECYAGIVSKHHPHQMIKAQAYEIYRHLYCWTLPGIVLEAASQSECTNYVEAFRDSCIVMQHVIEGTVNIGPRMSTLGARNFVDRTVRRIGRAVEVSGFDWKIKTSLDDSMVLTENDEEILQAMFELGSTESKAFSSKEILRKAGWETEGKHAFERLIKFGYVRSKKGVGYCLTESGASKAREVGART